MVVVVVVVVVVAEDEDQCGGREGLLFWLLILSFPLNCVFCLPSFSFSFFFPSILHVLGQCINEGSGHHLIRRPKGTSNAGDAMSHDAGRDAPAVHVNTYHLPTYLGRSPPWAWAFSPFVNP